MAGVDVEWRVPEEQAHAEADWIHFFALMYHSPGIYNSARAGQYRWSEFEWVRPWLRSLLDEPGWWQALLPGLLAAVLAGLWLGGRAPPAPTLVLVGAGLLASAVWLRAAPRPPFGFGYFWITTAGLGAHLARREWRAASLARLRFGLLSIAALPILVGTVSATRRGAAAQFLFVRPDPQTWLQPTRWDYAIVPYITATGLSVGVPVGHRCSRASLPCTSHPAPNLRLRRRGDLSSGFAVDGPWLAERWPNPWSRFRSGRRPPASAGGPTAPPRH